MTLNPKLETFGNKFGLCLPFVCVQDELLALVDQNGHVALHDIMLVLKVVSTFELTTLGDANYENSESDDASTQRGFDSLTPRFEHNTMEQVHNYIHANTDEIFAKLEVRLNLIRPKRIAYVVSLEVQLGP